MPVRRGKDKTPKQQVSDQEVEAVIVDWDNAFEPLPEKDRYKWARWLIKHCEKKQIDVSPTAVIHWLKWKGARSPRWYLSWMVANKPEGLRGIGESFHQWRCRVVKATKDIGGEDVK